MYSKLIIRALAAFLAISIFTSCEDQSIMLAPTDFGYEYYPVEIGNFWIYQMDSVTVMSGGQVKLETSSYIKEEITGSFINLEGDTSHVLTISKSPDLNGSFNLTDTYTIEKTGSRVTRNEENLRFIKLFFPITEGDELDANLFDHRIKVNIGQQEIEPYLEWQFKVLQEKVDRTFNNVLYEDLAYIQQAEYNTDLDIREAYEYYAPEIGLVRREHTILHSQCGTPCLDQPWLDKAQRGYTLVQTLVDYN